MPGSVLHTAELPAFDRKSGQLVLASHHLLSAPLSIAEAYDASSIPLFDPPSAQPYQQPSAVDGGADEGAEGPKRKRRRRVRAPDETSSAVDWIRHREREEARPTTDRESDAHHAEIVLELQNATEAVRGGRLAAECDGDDGHERWLGLREGYDWRRIEAGDTRNELDLVGLASSGDAAAANRSSPASPLALSENASVPALSLAGRIVTNECPDDEVQLDLTGDESEPLAQLCLPPSSGFLLSDMSTWSDASSGVTELGRKKGGWDILLLDPPWPNVSATRSASYETFDPYDLWKLDVRALLGDKPAVVAIWLTNRVKFRRLVKDKLFPSWDVRDVAEWYWIKVASETGEPVWPFSARHRRCYEGLLVGHFVPPGAATRPRPTIPSGKVFLSTPIGHSRKPCILELLRPYLVEQSRPPNVLEMFARMTLAGPSSVSSTPRAASGTDTDDAEAVNGFREGDQRRGFFLAAGNEAVKFNVVDQDRAGGVKGWIRTTDTRIG
ncbi:hypothetical protein JCM3774_005620 [Rhodotorula dairenensis]